MVTLMNSIQGIGMTSRRTRERMIDRLIDQGISNHKILDAMRSVPRHLFMDDALASRAYEDTALPIGHGQTISQPYIVAKMTELLVDQRHLKNVLEIGTGCGYLRNVSYLHNDGGWGWQEKAPFDGILVAAAPAEIPEKLLAQMAVGGIMLIPVGRERGVQELQRVIRTESSYEIESLELVSFVPFLSGRG
jgi:protein-L-isoaspartate(D-aspartate) O-methyltransferase